MVETFGPRHKLSKERNRDIPLAGRWVGTHRQMLQLSHIKRYDMIRLINIDAASKHVWTGKLEERTEVLQSTCRTFMALIHNSQHVQYRIHTYIYIYLLFIYLFIDIALHSHYTCLIQSAFINLFWLLVPMLNTSRLRSGALQQRCWSTASKAKRKDRASLCTRSTAYWRRSCYCYLISCVRMLPLFLRTLWGTWELDKISLGECGVLLVTWV